MFVACNERVNVMSKFTAENETSFYELSQNKL